MPSPPKDEDVLFSVRPDHQWTGAYPAWPPETARGLYRIGEVDLAFSWLRSLARSANQGPFGQAHFADNVVAPNEGGARKSPSEMPYINDWLSSSMRELVNRNSGRHLWPTSHTFTRALLPDLSLVSLIRMQN